MKKLKISSPSGIYIKNLIIQYYNDEIYLRSFHSNFL